MRHVANGDRAWCGAQVTWSWGKFFANVGHLLRVSRMSDADESPRACPACLACLDAVVAEIARARR